MYDFKTLPANPAWSFIDCSPKETAYISHGYYTYPAKFIPQLVQSLIKHYTKVGDIVVDPFMGSGTTILECMLNNRIGVGVDINEIACLVSRVKTTYLDSEVLNSTKNHIETRFLSSAKSNKIVTPPALENILTHSRIDFWFTPAAKLHLSLLLTEILAINDGHIKEFYLVCFAQILKICSTWLQVGFQK